MRRLYYLMQMDLSDCLKWNQSSISQRPESEFLGHGEVHTTPDEHETVHRRVTRGALHIDGTSVPAQMNARCRDRCRASAAVMFIVHISARYLLQEGS